MIRTERVNRICQHCNSMCKNIDGVTFPHRKNYTLFICNICVLDIESKLEPIPIKNELKFLKKKIKFLKQLKE